VLLEVLLAFGVPIAVFIVSLAVAGALFGGILTPAMGPVLVSLFLALTLTALVVAGICRLTQRSAHATNHRDEVHK
jgi:putative effector of murein hydrolase LrgA (UPF0299 family)